MCRCDQCTCLAKVPAQNPRGTTATRNLFGSASMPTFGRWAPNCYQQGTNRACMKKRLLRKRPNCLASVASRLLRVGQLSVLSLQERAISMAWDRGYGLAARLLSEPIELRGTEGLLFRDVEAHDAAGKLKLVRSGLIVALCH